MTNDPRHTYLDATLVILLAATVYLLENPQDVLKAIWNDFVSQPRVYDFINHPMNRTVATCIWLIDIYFLVKTYYLEKMVVHNAHKKYVAHKSTSVVALHGIGSSLELCVGYAAVLCPDCPHLAYATAAICLLINVPTAVLLTPKVFGVKCLTVPGFAKFAVLRAIEALRVLFVHPRLVGNLWLLLQVGTVVRLLGYFILPYTSSDNQQKGDLFTEPINYSFNILLSGYLTAATVYTPPYLFGALSVYVVGQMFYPPRISIRSRDRCRPEDASWREPMALDSAARVDRGLKTASSA